MAHTPIETPRRKRCPMSVEQRAQLSLAQRAYVAHDPRWPEHRRKPAAAQEARRMMLFDNEVAAIVALRRKGRTFSYIAEEIGVLPEPGAIYVMNRGYVDFTRLHGLHQAGAFFVTRAKSNLNAHRVYSVPTDRSAGVIADQTIALDGHCTKRDYQLRMHMLATEGICSCS